MPRNRASSSSSTVTRKTTPAAAVKKPAQKPKVKIPKGLFKRHVEEVTRGVIADLRGEEEGEGEEGDGGMMKWDKEALELLRGVMEGFFEVGGSGRRG